MDKQTVYWKTVQMNCFAPLSLYKKHFESRALDYTSQL